MSLRFSVSQSVEVPTGTPLAYVTPDGDVVLWPHGIAAGPYLSFTVADWAVLRDSVEAALERGPVDDLGAFLAGERQEG